MPKLYKLMFFNFSIISIIITISSSSWLMMWIGMELNLLFVIPIFSNKKNFYPSEASIKYFIVQALASSMFMFAIITNEMFYQINSFYFLTYNITFSALLMKLGMAPFHFWFPEVMSGLEWMSCLMLLTWQKIGPMIICMLLINNSMIVIMTILLSSIISGILLLNQIKLSKILAYSSINHMSWMMMSSLTSKSIWMIYFIIYSSINIFLILTFYKLNFFLLNQILVFKLNFYDKILLASNFISLAGIPPFIGFLPKWLVIAALAKNLFFVIPVILIISTLLSIFVYIRISILLIIPSSKNFYLNQNYNKFWFKFFNWTILMMLVVANLFF